MYIRRAVPEDFNQIAEIYRFAQEFMIRTGNSKQWGHVYPSEELIKDDIISEKSHVICNKERICGVFALCYGEEPTYRKIEYGRWRNNEPYITIHRMAGDGKVNGLFELVSEHCKKCSDNIRVDTHQDNHIMQRQFEKYGFQKCGIIHVDDGSMRIAYQWVRA